MESKNDYDKGYIDGLKAFAWWKDGVMYVGTCGWTLENAIRDREKSETYNPPKLAPLTDQEQAIRKYLQDRLDYITGDSNHTLVDRANGWTECWCAAPYQRPYECEACQLRRFLGLAG